jgi:hypothetical protein
MMRDGNRIVTLPFLRCAGQEKAQQLVETVYRKTTHTGLYLQVSSYHQLGQKYAVLSTLIPWAKTMCNSEHLDGRIQQQGSEASYINNCTQNAGLFLTAC